ncbi:MAG TPA: tetratricopeptide repeat protein [Flavipsychrobacter sp.]|nr:tetratricopeptide repeat protein [Flavipsychrobacter sp.]
MRKLVLILTAILTTASAMAQNSAVQSARNYLREKDFENAVKYINQALEDASTKDKPKTWYAKGDIYMKMMEDPNYQVKLPYKDAAEAYIKVVELDPEYEKEDVNTKLLVSAFAYYNEGIMNYNASKYKEATDALQNVTLIHGLEKGRRFKNKKFDTLAVSAKQMLGYSAYYQKNYDEALSYLNTAKESPITKNASVYLAIADIYSTQGKRDEQLATLLEARKAYPNDANLRNEEINFYIATNRTAELTKKLEDAIAAEPNNAELHYTLANIYNNMAFPKEGVARPGNAAELVTKAEAGYQKAIAAEPNNAEYNFNYSVLFYMQAFDKATQMNALSETAADMKKYEVLNKEYKDFLGKALPYAEKSYAVLDAKSSRDAREKEIYASTLKELMEIYGKLNQPEKFAEMKKKMEANK